MKKILTAIGLAASVAVAGMATTGTAEAAHWHGGRYGGWHRGWGGPGPVVGGLVAGAIIGGALASPYYYPYGYYGPYPYPHPCYWRTVWNGYSWIRVCQ
jgi:hypothetical protein